MSKFLAILVLCLPAFGQAVFSGHAAYSGAGIFSSGGVPAYLARTDNCVSGGESGCLVGTTTGETGSALSFLLRNSDSVPFADITSGNANINSTGSDPDFNSYLVMATDESTGTSCLGSAGWPSWNMGSAGEWDAFSTDSSLLLVHNNSGNACLLFLNPAAIHAKTCATASPACVSLTSGTVANSPIGSVGAVNTYNLASGGSWNFSRVPGETNVLYELENPPTTIDRVVICANGASSPNCSSWTGPGPLLRTVYQDFTSETGTAALPPRYAWAGWTSEFVTANDGSVAYGMGGGQDWITSWTPTVNETFLYPQTNAPVGSKGYQATAVTGPTGGSEPIWSNATTATPPGCPNAGETCSDGGVTWTNIGNIGGQGPGFDVVGYSPSQGSWRLNTRIGKIYRGTGNSVPAGPVTTNDNIACTRAANGGAITYPCALPDQYTLHDLSQAQNGRYVIMSPTGASGPNSSANWNWGTLSGQISSAIWSYGVGGGNGVWDPGINYTAHDVVVYGNPAFYYTANTTVASGQNAPPSNTNWTQTEGYPLDYYFDITTTNLAPCTDYLHCGGHQAQGYTEKVYGAKYRSALYSDPVINGSLNPDTVMLPNPLPCDFHGTWREGGTQDIAPIGIINTCVPAWPLAYTASCYGEICAVKSDGSGLTYRFAHDDNTGSSPFFQDQNNIGVISYLGDLIAWGTDMMGTRGDQSSANAVCTNKARGMYSPTAGMALTINSGVGDSLFPVTANAGMYIYQTTIAGTTSGSAPVAGWGQIGPVIITQVAASSTMATYTYTTTGSNLVAGGTIIVSGLTNSQFNGSGSPAGTGMTIASATSSQFTIAGTYSPIGTTTDNGTGYTTQAWGAATIQNIGSNSCRSDIVIVDLLSAHAAP
jgi:hypothetical protein